MQAIGQVQRGNQEGATPHLGAATRPYILANTPGLVIMLAPFPTREQLSGIFEPTVLKRLVHAGWLEKMDLGTRKTQFSLESVLCSIDRINAGILPPRLPSEPQPQGNRHVPRRGRDRTE